MSSGKSGKAQGKTNSIALVVAGVTQSDLVPYIGLALGLQRSGFGVKLVTHAVHSELAARYGLRFSALKGDPQAVLRTSAFRDALLSGSAISIGKLFVEDDRRSREPNFDLIHKACADADAVLCSISVLTECMAVCQKYGIAIILCPLLPFSPSGEIPLATVVPEPMRYTWLNKVSYDLSGLLLWAYFGASFNKFRAKLGVGPQSGYILDGISQVTGFSPLVVPRPADWGPHVHCTNHWALPEAVGAAAAEALAHPALASLLASPPSAEPSLRPVFITFESVPLPDPVAFLRAAYGVAAKIGVPVILAAGATDLASVRTSPRIADLSGLVFDELGSGSEEAFAALRGPRLLVVGDVTPSLILPHCSVIVHHGSAFMTQTAMEAGVPAVVFPGHGADFFWAARVSALGAGPLVSYPLRQFPEKLEEGITVARQAAVFARAAALGVSLRGLGDGVQLAVVAIRDILSRPQHRHCGVTCAWAADNSSDKCTVCEQPFTMTNRRRHCRSCGRLACGACLTQRCHLPGFPDDAPQIICTPCLDSRRAFFAIHTGTSVLPTPVGGAAAAAAGPSAGSSSSGFERTAMSSLASPGAGSASSSAGGSGVPASAAKVTGSAAAAAASGAMLRSPASAAPSLLKAANGTFSPLPL